jgi:hypothetical protein
MHRSTWRRVLLTGLFFFLQTSISQAQGISATRIPRAEFGVQFIGLALSAPVTRGSIGFGAHAGYNLSHYVSLDADLNHFSFGETPAQHSGTLMGFAGVRAGVTIPKGGLYFKVRPGLVHFPRNGELQTRGLTQLNHFALDTGFVLLRYFPNHTYVRFDLGETIITYGSGSVTNSSGRLVYLGTTNNANISVGFGLHF